MLGIRKWNQNQGKITFRRLDISSSYSDVSESKSESDVWFETLFHLLRYQTSIGKSENITDENLDKKREVDDCKKEPTILCIGWIAWWFSKSIWAIQFQVGSS